MTFAGGCLCGKVRYQANAEPLWVCHCHCSMCRKHTGSSIATYVGFPPGTVIWLTTEPTRYRSSKYVERSFCPACGSTIGFHRVHESYVGFAAGTTLLLGSLDAPESLPIAAIPTNHVWFKDHIPWFDTADDWTRFAEFPTG